MSKIFKTGAKNSILMVFAAAIMAAGFWLAAAPKAEAACGGECVSSGGVCYYDGGTGYSKSYKICTINNPTAIDRSGTSNCSSGSGANQKKCWQDSCPDLIGDELLNGKNCNILEATGSDLWCRDSEVIASGFWDANQDKCIKCSSFNEETKILGDNMIIPDTDLAGDGKFDTACSSNVSSQCDEQPLGCVGTGGFCNDKGAYTSCISPATCSGSGAGAVCTELLVSALTISANPSGPITANTPTSITFTVTSGGSSVVGATVTLSGIASGTCTAVSGSCPIIVNASAAGTITATASKTGSTSGTATVAVQSAGALIVTMNLTSAPIDSTISTLRVTVKKSDGISTVPGANVSLSSDSSKSCTTDVDTGFPCTITNVSVTGNITVTATDPADLSVTGMATITAIGIVTPPVTGGCTPPLCDNSSNPNKYCKNGSWVNCLSGFTCDTISGVCGSGGSTAPIQPPAPVVTSCTPNKCNSAGQYCVGTTWTDCGSNQTCGAGGVCVLTCSGGGMYESPLSFGYCSIGEILAKATSWILSLVSSIIVLVIIIGGLMYISSAGDEERLRASKNIIYYAIIGLGIILISAALINEVTNLLKGT